MGFSFASLKRGLPLAAIAAAVVFPAQAQRLLFRKGQPIMFSAPTSENALSNTPSLSPKPPASLDLENATEAPEQFNFDRSPAAPLPMVAPYLSPAEAARERDLLDRRRNWALLTPGEILNEVTPEKIMGLTERNVFGQPKYSTAMERYAARQSQLQLLARTNLLPAGNLSPAWLSPGERRSMSNAIYGGWDGSESLSGPLFNPAPNNQILARPDEDGGWSKLFESTSTPKPTPWMSKPNPAPAENLERFRQLLNRGSSPAVSAAAADGLKTSLPQSLLGSGLAQPQPVRIGASFAPLNSGIGKPGELPKLTGAFGLNYTSPPPAAPWVSPNSQPLAAPQRKF
jgi:hypothetical protein